MNSYRLPFFCLFLGILVSGLGLSTTGICGTPKKEVNSLLWKISGKGIKTSYLYGTFHLVPKDQFSLPEKVQQNLVKSQTVVFEVDLDSPLLTHGISKAMKMAQPLESLMTVSDYDFLTNFVQDSLYSNLHTFRYIKPGFLGQLLLYPKLLGYNPESYDLALLKLAKKWHKNIFALETPQEQIALLDQSDIELQTAQFLNNIRQFDRQRKLMNRMLNLYQAEDLDGLYHLINAEQDNDQAQDLLLNQRNQKWLMPLVNKMKSSRSFIAVGAAHLPGQQGLIELLRSQGYSVEAVY